MRRSTVVMAVAGGIAVGAVCAAVMRWSRRSREEDEWEEVEETVEVEDDVVRVVPDLYQNPPLDTVVTEYSKAAEPYSGKEVPIPQMEVTAAMAEAHMREMGSEPDWVQISFDKHEYGNREMGYSIREAWYYQQDDVLAWWNGRARLQPCNELGLYALARDIAREDDESESVWVEEPDRKVSVEVHLMRDMRWSEAYLKERAGDDD